MNDTEAVQIDLHAASTPFPIFVAALRGVLARGAGPEDAERLGAEIAEAARPILTAPHAVDPVAQGRPLVATFTMAEQPRRLIVAVDDSWRTERLASAPATDRGHPPIVDEYPPAVDAGVGLLIMHRLMDEVDYRREEAGNRWRLTKRVPPATSNDTDDFTTSAVTIDLPASYRYLNVIGDCIEAMLAGQWESDQSDKIYELQLAAQELCTNIVDHAYRAQPGRFEVTVTYDKARGVVEVESFDRGQVAADLPRVRDPQEPVGPTRRGLISGSALLFASATLVNAGNYLFNLLLGRWLGPAAFADLSLIVTLFLMTSFLTAGIQTPAARFSALYVADGDLASVANLRRWLSRLSGGIGLGLILLFAVGAPLWAQFFATDSMLPFVIFGLFVPFYVLQGVDRGLLQGRTRFRWLAVTYQVEMWSRLFLSLGFVAVGWAVNGAVTGIALSFVAAWWAARRVRVDLPAALPLPPAVRREVMLFVGPVLIAQLGQILINNSDILIVRRFFPAEQAGHYAALALTGRIVFFATWSVVTAMFPIVAQRYRRGESHRTLLFMSLGIVVTISLAIIVVLRLFPEQIINLLFGPAYLSIAPLLWLYALATMFYALANVVINYRLSIGSVGGTYVAIASGIAQVALIWFFHNSLAQVVMLQVGLMFGLFVVLLGWDLARSLTVDGESKS